MTGPGDGTSADEGRPAGGDPPPSGEGATRRPGRPWLKLALLVAVVAGGLGVAHLTPVGDYLTRDGVGRAIEALRDEPAAPVVFVAVYALATALAVPGTVLTLAGGALFGVFWGTVYNSIAANLGANAAFFVARYLGRDAVERLTGDRLEKLDRATRSHGFKGLLTLRLVPLVPFNALNFGAGLTAMPWRTYAVATLVGILPGTIVYTMFADALLAGSQEASREAFLRVALSGGLLVLLAFLPTLLKKMNVKLPGAALLVPLLLGSGAAGALAAHAAPSDPPRVPTATAAAAERPTADTTALPDHAAFTDVLEDVVRGARVDYAALEASRSGLDRYLERLAAVEPATLAAASRDARLAFWINAYNACMLRLVVDHYPIEEGGGLLQRVKNLVADRPSNSVWQIDDTFTRHHCPVAGEPRSQDEIEHEIIRPMGEPRIHFAVNCAAVSCPSLDDQAYTADELDAQLERQVRRFMATPRHFALEENADGPVLRLNKVLDWYKEDFGGVDGLVAFFRERVEGARRALLDDPALEVRFREYDWTLNDVEG